MPLPHHHVVRAGADVRGFRVIARLVIAHDQVAQPVRAVWNRLLLGPAVGAAQAIDNAQVGPLDEDLVAVAAEMLQEGLQGGDPLLQPLLTALDSHLRSACWQGPGEPRQHEEATGQAAPPAQSPFNGLSVLM